jgi:hypothetical protein
MGGFYRACKQGCRRNNDANKSITYDCLLLDVIIS